MLTESQIIVTAQEIACRVQSGGIVWCCGNGGSAAQADHFAAELVGRLHRNRPPIAAVSLCGQGGAVPTCIANDFGFDEIFSRQLEALAKPGDVLIAISTSGSSENVLRAIQSARAKGAHVVGLCGASGMHVRCDELISVSCLATWDVQDEHSAICHRLAHYIERFVFHDRN